MLIKKTASSKNHPSQSVSGITLVELLLAIAILGVITTVTAMTFSVGIESWRAGAALSDSSNQADFLMEQIVMGLRSAYYPESSGNSGEYGFVHEDNGGDFPNASDKISWVKIGNSLVGEDAAWAGAAHRVEVFLETGKGEEGPGLYVKAWQLVGLDDDFDPEQDVTPVLLSDQVVSFDCRIRDESKKIEPGNPYEWMDEEWTETNKIPHMVLVSLAIKAKKERDPPMEFVRCVELPMAEMAWNPIDTAAESDKKNSRRSRANRSRSSGSNNTGVRNISTGGGTRNGK